MCAHGCTVVFKPKEAFMLTKEGNRIPFTEERGLYFLSLGKQGKQKKNKRLGNDQEGVVLALVSNEPPVSKKENSGCIDKTVRRTMRMLKRAHYHPMISNALRLDHECFIEAMHAHERKIKLHRRVKRYRKQAKTAEIYLRRSPRVRKMEEAHARTTAKMGF